MFVENINVKKKKEKREVHTLVQHVPLLSISLVMYSTFHILLDQFLFENIFLLK